MISKYLNRCEDSLTASVFTHLLHLPAELFWRLILEACSSSILPVNAGEVLDYQFWPSWDAEGTSNRHRVIPDLLLRFAEFDVIVEAKRWDEGMQSSWQWKRELKAYANEYAHEGKPVYMIALGGIHGYETEKISCVLGSDEETGRQGSLAEMTCSVIMCRWSALLHQCQRMLRELNRLAFSSSQHRANSRILQHTIGLFQAHDFATGWWLTDVDLGALRLRSNAESGVAVLVGCRQSFQN